MGLDTFEARVSSGEYIEDFYSFHDSCICSAGSMLSSFISDVEKVINDVVVEKMNTTSWTSEDHLSVRHVSEVLLAFYRTFLRGEIKLWLESFPPFLADLIKNASAPLNGFLVQPDDPGALHFMETHHVEMGKAPPGVALQVLRDGGRVMVRLMEQLYAGTVVSFGDEGGRPLATTRLDLGGEVASIPLEDLLPLEDFQPNPKEKKSSSRPYKSKKSFSEALVTEKSSGSPGSSGSTSASKKSSKPKDSEAPSLKKNSSSSAEDEWDEQYVEHELKAIEDDEEEQMQRIREMNAAYLERQKKRHRNSAIPDEAWSTVSLRENKEEYPNCPHCTLPARSHRRCLECGKRIDKENSSLHADVDIPSTSVAVSQKRRRSSKVPLDQVERRDKVDQLKKKDTEALTSQIPTTTASSVQPAGASIFSSSSVTTINEAINVKDAFT